MKSTVFLLCFGITFLIASVMFGSTEARRRPTHSHHHRNTTEFNKESCKLSPDTGRCRAAVTKWYYDYKAGECKTFIYGGCEGNANIFKSKVDCLKSCGDKKSAPPSNSSVTCSRVRCRMHCSLGFAVDSNGCEICRCNLPINGTQKNNTESCSPIMCAMYCEHGFIKNSNGCDVCSCNLPPRPVVNCPQIECPDRCANGYKTEKNGCMTCECKTAPTEVIRPKVGGRCGDKQCRNECPNGRKKDRRGCEECECKEEKEEKNVSCRPNKCHKTCSFGFETNDFGCPLCACKSRRASSRADKRPGAPVQIPAQLPADSDAEIPAQIPVNIPSKGGRKQAFSFDGVKKV